MKLLQGWILDLYPNQHGMTLWLIDRNQTHYRLTDSIRPRFLCSGSAGKLARLQDAAQKQTTELRTRLTERIDLWLNATRPVLEVSVHRPIDFVGWGRWVHRFDSRLQLYNSDLMVASLYCWEKRLFPLAYVEVEADDEGRILAIECRDDEWTLDYEMPPLKIMQIRLAGLSRIDPDTWSPSCSRNRSGWNLLGTRRNRRAAGIRICAIAQTRGPRRNSFRVGRLNYSASAAPAGGAIEVCVAPESRLRSCRPAIKAHAATRATAGYFSKRAR